MINAYRAFSIVACIADLMADDVRVPTQRDDYVFRRLWRAADDKDDVTDATNLP